MGWFSSTDSRKGERATRRVCVGEISSGYIWFEVCDDEAEDFRRQYAIPLSHQKYTTRQLSELSALDESDRSIYNLTAESENTKGTKWRYVSLEKCGELPPGYQKNKFTL